MVKKKIKICKNHLSVLFEALEIGDISLIKKVEHQLTSVEECIACAYTFKFHGIARETLVDYLVKEGFSKGLGRSDNDNVGKSPLQYWGLRLILFSAIFISVLTIRVILNHFLFKLPFKGLFSLGPFEIIYLSLISLIIFLLIDDRFLD